MLSFDPTRPEPICSGRCLIIGAAVNVVRFDIISLLTKWKTVKKERKERRKKTSVSCLLGF